MKMVAPLQKKIQEKYKNDPQRLQKEMGKLWKEHGVNPISGCLPMLIQWPILMAFFIVFRSTVEFRGAPFVLWINDLSQPDYLFSLPFELPLYGGSVAILPILMGISMFLTMRITMQSTEGSQKTFMYFMNGFFILIFNSFPSGLTLYYTMFNFLSYQQQLSIKNKK
jgi:YidC/Oxa1 family membrane protein insertase